MGETSQSAPFDPYHRWLGISPRHQPANFYRLLGLELFESDPEVIRDAAERQMAHVRTYQLGPRAALSQRILNELAAAKACLQDPAARAAYDAELQAAIPPSMPGPAHHAMVIPIPPPVTQRPGRKRFKVVLLAGGGLIVVMMCAVIVSWPTEGSRRSTSDASPEAAPPAPIGAESHEPQPVSAETADGGEVDAKPREAERPDPESLKNEMGPVKKEPSAAAPPSMPKAVPPKTEAVASEKPPPLSDKGGQTPLPRRPLAIEDMDLRQRAVREAHQSWIAGAFRGNKEIVGLVSTEKRQTWVDALCSHRSGELTGATITFYPRRDPLSMEVRFMQSYEPSPAANKMAPESEAPRLALVSRLLAEIVRCREYLTLEKGLRKGLSATWDELGRRVYVGEYEDDLRHGSCVFFAEDKPRLLVEFVRGHCKGVHLVAGDVLERSFADEAEAGRDARARPLLQETAEHESLLTERVGLLKKLVRESNAAGGENQADWVVKCRQELTRSSSTFRSGLSWEECKIRFPSGRILHAADLNLQQKALSKSSLLWGARLSEQNREMAALFARDAQWGLWMECLCHWPEQDGSGETFTFSAQKDPVAFERAWHRAAMPGYAEMMGGVAQRNAQPPAWANVVRCREYLELKQGARHGIAGAWDAQGRRLYLAEYEDDALHGFCCLFDNDSLRLVLECTGGKIEGMHLIADGKLQRSLIEETERSRDPEVRAILQRMEGFDSQLAKRSKLLRSAGQNIIRGDDVARIAHGYTRTHNNLPSIPKKRSSKIK